MVYELESQQPFDLDEWERLQVYAIAERNRRFKLDARVAAGIFEYYLAVNGNGDAYEAISEEDSAWLRQLGTDPDRRYTPEELDRIAWITRDIVGGPGSVFWDNDFGPVEMLCGPKTIAW